MSDDIESILAAAAKLSHSDLAKLSTRVQQLERESLEIALRTRRGIQFRLGRLNDVEVRELSCRSLAIEEDYGFYMGLGLALREKNEPRLNFAQVYLTLKHLTDGSSCWLDEFKMGFSFPFALQVVKGSNSHSYLLEVRNIRDGPYFSLRKPVRADDARLKEGLEHPPFEEEFGREEINYFISYLYGYLEGRWQCFQTLTHQPFVRRVPASGIIFGYLGGRAFEEHFPNCKDYEDAWPRYTAKLRAEIESGTSSSDACLLVKAPSRNEEKGEPLPG